MKLVPLFITLFLIVVKVFIDPTISWAIVFLPIYGPFLIFVLLTLFSIHESSK